MAGLVEFGDDATQYAAQNRVATAGEKADIERLSGSRPEKQHSVEVERLAKLYDEKNVHLPTSIGAKKSSDDPRVQRALRILRGDI